jgi:hypothetical protein
VPDLRGLFLRGLGGQSAAIGVKQTDATYVREGETTQTLLGVQEKILGGGPGISSDDWGFIYYGLYTVLTTGFSPNAGSPTRHSSGSKVDLNFKINTPGVEETRPTNTAVRYLMRALP